MTAMRKHLLKDMIQAGALIGSAFFLGLFLPNGTAQNAEGEAMPVVEFEEVQQASKTGTPRLIDARGPEAFAAGHIPKAINLPNELSDEKIKEAAPAMNEIIVYCSGHSCKDSEHLAARLIKFGAEGIRIYRGGWEEWEIITRP